MHTGSLWRIPFDAYWLKNSRTITNSPGFLPFFPYAQGLKFGLFLPLQELLHPGLQALQPLTKLEQIICNPEGQKREQFLPAYIPTIPAQLAEAFLKQGLG